MTQGVEWNDTVQGVECRGWSGMTRVVFTVYIHTVLVQVSIDPYPYRIF